MVNSMRVRITFKIFVFLLSFTGIVYGQTNFRGIVLDKKTKAPIAGAKIGISDQGIGEVSNDKGYFVYSRPNKVLDKKSKLEISASGYKTIIKSEEELRQLQGLVSTIYLDRGRKSKRKTIDFKKVTLEVS